MSYDAKPQVSKNILSPIELRQVLNFGGQLESDLNTE